VFTDNIPSEGAVTVKPLKIPETKAVVTPTVLPPTSPSPTKIEENSITPSNKNFIDNITSIVNNWLNGFK
jgi:hypothetical protein